VKKRVSNSLCVWLPVFFLVAYVVSYFALVSPTGYGDVRGVIGYVPSYRVNNRLKKAGEYLYRPLYYLDAKIFRPQIWYIQVDSLGGVDIP
jgi:hypothetical protein